MTLDFLGDTSKYFSNYTPSDLASNTFSGVNYDYSLPTSDMSGLWGDSLIGGGEGIGGGFSLGNLPWGQITNVLGKLGAGLGSGISAYQSGQQADYIPYTRWLGNGLATTSYINNTANKQNKLDQAVGSGQILGNFPGDLFGLFNKGTGEKNLTHDLRQVNNQSITTPMANSTYGNNNYGLPTTVDYNKYRPNWI